MRRLLLALVRQGVLVVEAVVRWRGVRSREAGGRGRAPMTLKYRQSRTKRAIYGGVSVVGSCFLNAAFSSLTRRGTSNESSPLSISGA